MKCIDAGRCTHLRHTRRWLASALVVALATTSIAPVAAAEVSAADKSLAAQLFTDARALMKKGDFADACPKLLKAGSLDPAADGIVFNLGLCFKGLGKYATAWAHFNDALVRAKKPPVNAARIKAATEEMNGLEPKLSKLTIEVPEAARVVGLSVSLDDSPIEAAVWSTPVNLDPGLHHLVATAIGYKTWAKDIEIAATADRKTIEVPKLTAEAPAKVEPTVVTPPPPATPLVVAPKPAPSKTAAWIALGTGGVLIIGAVGSFFLAKSAQSDRRDFCAGQPGASCPDDDSRSRLHRWETIGVISGGLGLVATGLGFVLLKSSPSSSSAKTDALRIVPGVTLGGGASLQFTGAF